MLCYIQSPVSLSIQSSNPWQLGKSIRQNSGSRTFWGPLKKLRLTQVSTHSVFPEKSNKISRLTAQLCDTLLIGIKVYTVFRKLTNWKTGYSWFSDQYFSVQVLIIHRCIFRREILLKFWKSSWCTRIKEMKRVILLKSFSAVHWILMKRKRFHDRNSWISLVAASQLLFLRLFVSKLYRILNLEETTRTNWKETKIPTAWTCSYQINRCESLHPHETNNLQMVCSTI